MAKQYVVISGVSDPKIARVVVDSFKAGREGVPLDELVRKFKTSLNMDPTMIINEGDKRLETAKSYGWYVYEVIEGIVYDRPPIR